METGSLELFRRCRPVVDARYDTEDDRAPSVMIIEALAEAANVSPADLPPLYDHVDIEAIDFLFQKHSSSSEQTVLSFQVDHWNVFVRGDGLIRVCDARSKTDPEPVFATA